MGPKKNKKKVERPRVLFYRDSDNNLLPGNVELISNKNKYIKIIPLTKGESNLLNSMIESNVNNSKITIYVLDKCLIEPKLNVNDLKYFNSLYFSDVVQTILFECGYSLGKKQNGRPSKSCKRINYERYNKDFNYVKELLFCLKNGVPLETYLKLTYREVDLLGNVSVELNKAKPVNTKTVAGKRR